MNSPSLIFFFFLRLPIKVSVIVVIRCVLSPGDSHCVGGRGNNVSTSCLFLLFVFLISHNLESLALVSSACVFLFLALAAVQETCLGNLYLSTLLRVGRVDCWPLVSRARLHCHSSSRRFFTW